LRDGRQDLRVRRRGIGAYAAAARQVVVEQAVGVSGRFQPCTDLVRRQTALLEALTQLGGEIGSVLQQLLRLGG
jgi:hypothetical protein